MKAKEWLEKEEWENVAVDSQKWSHYTMMDKIMEEYAKVYLKNKLEEIDKNTKLNKFL
jgi:ABC-type histidine transport system ATPase subunit